MMSEETYTFTRKQLNDLLGSTIEMFFEYRDAYDKPEISAKWAAVDEMMKGLDADKELVAMGEKPLNLQVHTRDKVLEIAKNFTTDNKPGKIQLIKALRVLTPEMSLSEAKERVETMFSFYPGSVMLCD